MKKYITPEVEICALNNANIIATSFNIDNAGDPINDGGKLVGRQRHNDEDDWTEEDF